MMVEVQSSWFPLYDRNPQTYVENIMKAPAEAYKAETVSHLWVDEVSVASRSTGSGWRDVALVEWDRHDVCRAKTR